MIPDERLQQIIEQKNERQARRSVQKHGYTEGWAIIDGCLVIYDVDDSPTWLTEKLVSRDDDGNTSAFHNADERSAA